jgi:two-component system chemotaxis response regulator CheB
VDEKLKILLVDDSSLMRVIISDIISNDTEMVLVDTANNGKEAYEKAKSLDPDVVVLDMVMSEYDGLYAVKQIIENHPKPIVLLSSLERNDPQILDALSAGAFDFVDKPKAKAISQLRSVDQKLIRTIRAASRANMRVLTDKARRRVQENHTFATCLSYDIIAIGASTGGPRAVEAILERLPSNLSIPVVIAQHMPENFVRNFALRLDNISPLRVKVAEEGEQLRGGYVYLAAGKKNTYIKRDIATQRISFSLTNRKYEEFNEPSIDCLFDSVAEIYRSRSIAAVLTGMGRDGTLGMKKIYQAGGLTIAQDEASSVVFGMPKSVIETGVARHTISLQDIPLFIISCL